eukprot:scaffold77428_cov57-Phaeocystis_antarctica.AAC.1
MCEPCTPETLLEAVRGLRVAEPDLGFKPLLAKLQAQQPDLGAATREVREALAVLKAENEAAKAATAAPPAADEGAAPLPVALSLACIGCFRLPSDMDDEREKHPICDMCRDLKMPTTYLCGVNCPANPGAWELHGAFHKKVRKDRKTWEDGGVGQQQAREIADEVARRAAQSGDRYDELLAEGTRYHSKQDWRKAGKAYREAIALRPDRPTTYYNLGATLSASGHRGGRAAVPRGQGALRGGLGALGTSHGSGLRQAAAGGVRRGGQAGVVERRGAQGAVGEGCEGVAERG